MKQQLFKRKEAEGKTVDRIVPDWKNSQWLVLFTDGTFFYLRAQRGDAVGDEEIEFTVPFDPLEFGSDRLVNAGLLTREEIEAKQQARREAWGREKLAHERRQDEHFKRKFGDA
jgi:hypothetical protein